MDINEAFPYEEMASLVPIARGQHLFPCRTQQLSLVAVTILGPEPWENSTVPNFDQTILKRVVFSYTADCTVLFSPNQPLK